MSDPLTPQGFLNLSLSEPVLKALNDVGYEIPSPIQKQIIPHILAGRDVLGQAQTGTGKTAAFALPLLSRISLEEAEPQILVLTPTRELSIQVAEAFQRYAAHIKGFHVVPIYGGQGYETQLRQFKRGVHVVVGTPGRIMDHIRRGTLRLETIKCFVLDEADEMLRMGFLEDVEWILERTPPERQIALFSATIPKTIRHIAQRYLHNPVEVSIEIHTKSAETILQNYWIVNGIHKLDALTRILEAEPFDGMLIFVRTKNAAVELAEKLEARGYASLPLNGDIPQKTRERTVEHFKAGKLDILVATDVAARGLDVDRISHVINYDIPYDTDTYVHRVGRTGRAGRSGKAILFIAPKEKWLIKNIENATKQKIELLEMPTTEAINDKRIARFKQRITETLASEDINFYVNLIEQYQQEENIPLLNIAASLAKLTQGDQPLLLSTKVKNKETFSEEPSSKSRRQSPAERSARDEEMEKYRIEVGHNHKVKPGNIVGAIANEAGLKSEEIGRIEIYDDYSLIDLPKGMPKEVLNLLKKVWVSGQKLKIARATEEYSSSPKPRSSSRTKSSFKDNKKESFKDKSKSFKDKKTAPKKKKAPM